MEKAECECRKLINKIRQKNIANEYRDEINQHMYLYNWIRYLAVYKSCDIPTARRIHFEMDK